ncbi:MAG: hypothetical protein HYU48_00650 [Candidatus Levybacteria bacterium]|nr:hypothetical protein [Candidatus Levybacteria bacterium]
MADIFVAHNYSKKEEESVVRENPNQPEKAKHHVHLFSTFCTNPDDIRFENQKEGEEILLFLRRHFITNISWIFISILLVLIPSVIPFFLPILNMDLSFVPAGLLAILIPFYYLGIFSYILVNFMTWFYNIFIVTKERVVDIDYSHTVIHNVSETKTSHLQDASYSQTGFISSIFNYGNVFVQTAGTEVNFEALAAPSPRKAVEIIASLIGAKK